MHIERVIFHPEAYPVNDAYPFSLEVFRSTPSLELSTNITFFIGENGAGKSTLLKAMARRSGVYIWEEQRERYEKNPHEETLFRYIDVIWTNGRKPGAFFSSERFQHLSKLIDELACSDPGLLEYFGGKSLLSQSHGESFMSYFRARYAIEGVYFLDEPETALSPRRQIEFIDLLEEQGSDGHAQFVIATHSPILLSCPGARILCFDNGAFAEKAYEETDYYLIYRDFLLARERGERETPKP
jgi:predicted ATPase